MVTFEALANGTAPPDKQTLFDEWLAKASSINRPKIIEALKDGAKVSICDDGGYHEERSHKKGWSSVTFTPAGNVRIAYGGLCRA